MTGPKGNSDFYLPELLNVPSQGRGETKLTASHDASHYMFINLYLLIQKYGTKCKKNHFLDVNLPWFQGSQPDHVQTEYSGCCFFSELSKFCSPYGVSEF